MTDRDMYYSGYGYGGFTPLNNMPLGYQSPNRLGACGQITFVALCEERPYYFVEFKDGDRGRYYPSWCLTKN